MNYFLTDYIVLLLYRLTLEKDCPGWCFTLNNGQQDNNDEEEESDVEDDAIKLVLVTIRGLDLVTDAAASPHALVQVEHEALRAREKVIDYWTLQII